MSFSAPSAPTPPSVSDQTNAQTAANKQTNLSNFTTNNPNTYTPYGSSTYTANPVDANGNTSFNNKITFSPTQQALYDQSTANQTQQGQVAGTALGGVTNQFNTPYDLQGAVGGMTASQQDLTGDYNNQYDTLYKQQTAYLDPQTQNTQNQLDASLANQGILPGSAAYNNAQDEQNRNTTFAYQQAANQAQAGAGAEQTRLANLGLQNQQQAAQLYTQQYQEPLNLYNSLQTGTQASLPQFNATSTSNSAAPNVLGAYANNMNAQNNAYNAQTGSYNATIGALGSLGGAAASRSDARCKANIKKLGKIKGHNLYEFEYIGDDSKHIGVMAQEVKAINPDAVIVMPDGFYAVDYSKIGIMHA